MGIVPGRQGHEVCQGPDARNGDNDEVPTPIAKEETIERVPTIDLT